jgi:hypothetical protein
VNGFGPILPGWAPDVRGAGPREVPVVGLAREGRRRWEGRCRRFERGQRGGGGGLLRGRRFQVRPDQHRLVADLNSLGTERSSAIGEEVKVCSWCPDSMSHMRCDGHRGRSPSSRPNGMRRRTEQSGLAGEPELGIDAFRGAGDERPEQDGEDAAAFGEVVEDGVEALRPGRGLWRV